MTSLLCYCHYYCWIGKTILTDTTSCYASRCRLPYQATSPSIPPPPYAKPIPTASPAASSWEGWKTTESQSHLHSGMVLRPTARYESDCVLLTDTCLVASRPSSPASARKRPKASLMPTLRERNVKLTSNQAAGATSIGTATHLQCSLAPLVGQDLVSWTTGTLGGKSFMGIDHMQICTVSNNSS